MAEQYLGYILPQEDGQVRFMRFDEPVSDNFYKQFDEIISVTSEMRPYVIDFMGLQENFKAFERLPGEFKTSIEAATNPIIEGSLGGSQRLWKAQNALSNFLYSASAFRDRSLTRVRDRYGEQSEHCVKLSNVIREAYDGSFDYRLFYNLRNYAQHHDIPLSLVPIKASRNNESSKMEATVSVVLSPQKLVSNPKVQPKFAAKELLPLTDNLDLLVGAKTFFRLHAGLMKLIIGLQGPRLAIMHSYREEVEKHLKLPAGAYPVLWEGAMPMAKGEEAKAKFTHFSFDELNLILAMYEHVTRLCSNTVD